MGKVNTEDGEELDVYEDAPAFSEPQHEDGVQDTLEEDGDA